MAAGVRLVQKVSATRAFARIAPHVVPAADRAVHRLTRGRVLLSARMLPGLVLTVPGARSGLPRTTPLACVPEGEGAARSWLLVGSNFGRPGHPAWTANLLAGPDRAVVNWHGRDIPVRATLLSGAEREAAWRAAVGFWPPYASYQARVEREIRLFRLEQSGDATG
ncbi:nitroreductase family deazaflavin-dependent oxidoreductase [Streptomyces sp. PTD5-9]|uniref:nitroreductase family deazaflavin-dependent oxidoreductase n=1 Tax=Streptomyces sp. PTD5-9 TaxID=3120150 RepID=UPI00300A3508